MGQQCYGLVFVHMTFAGAMRVCATMAGQAANLPVAFQPIRREDKREDNKARWERKAGIEQSDPSCWDGNHLKGGVESRGGVLCEGAGPEVEAGAIRESNQ